MKNSLAILSGLQINVPRMITVLLPAQQKTLRLFDIATGKHTNAVEICQQNANMSVPEFPSLALPVSMIIGFLGAVLLIQRTREN